MLVGVRSRIFTPDPGCAGVMMLAPATLPWIEASGFIAGTGRSSALTRATVNGTRRAVVASVTPVTITASSGSAVMRIEKLTSTLPSEGTRTFSVRASAYPISFTSTAWIPAGTFGMT